MCYFLAVLCYCDHSKGALRCSGFTRPRYIAAMRAVAFAKQSHPAQDSQTVADMRRRSDSALGKNNNGSFEN